MRWLWAIVVGAALAALTGSSAIPQGIGPQQFFCNRSANGAGAVGTTQIVAPIATQAVTFCGFEVTAAAAATFQIITGAGATCGTNTLNITAAYDLGALSGLTGTSRQVSGAQGAGMCVIVTGTGPVHYTVYYAQL